MDISCVIVATISLGGYTSTFIMTCLWLPTRIYIFKEHEICRRPTDQREVIVRIYRMCIKSSSKKRKLQSPSGSFALFCSFVFVKTQTVRVKKTNTYLSNLSECVLNAM